MNTEAMMYGSRGAGYLQNKIKFLKEVIVIDPNFLNFNYCIDKQKGDNYETSGGSIMNGLFIKTITIFEVVKVLFLPDIGTFSYLDSNKSNSFPIGFSFDA